VLAVNTSGGSIEKALEFYRRAEELGPQAREGSPNSMSQAVCGYCYASLMLIPPVVAVLVPAPSIGRLCCWPHFLPHTTLSTKLPLPQVVPSERLAEELRNDELWMRMCMRPYLR
jgi:hypothetical protein